MIAASTMAANKAHAVLDTSSPVPNRANGASGSVRSQVGTFRARITRLSGVGTTGDEAHNTVELSSRQGGARSTGRHAD
jgi:hypothetical protein